MTDAGELREVIARTIAESDGVDFDHYLTVELGLASDYRRAADAVLALPALCDVLDKQSHLKNASPV